jgi:hypothetical protein
LACGRHKDAGRGRRGNGACRCCGGEGDGETVLREGEKLFGVVGEGPFRRRIGRRAVQQGEARAGRRGFGDRPGAHPGIAVQAVGFADKIAGELMRGAVQCEAGLGDAVGIGDEGVGGNGAAMLGSEARVADGLQQFYAAPHEGGDGAAGGGIQRSAQVAGVQFEIHVTGACGCGQGCLVAAGRRIERR